MGRRWAWRSDTYGKLPWEMSSSWSSLFACMLSKSAEAVLSWYGFFPVTFHAYDMYELLGFCAWSCSMQMTWPRLIGRPGCLAWYCCSLLVDVCCMHMSFLFRRSTRLQWKILRVVRSIGRQISDINFLICTNLKLIHLFHDSDFTYAQFIFSLHVSSLYVVSIYLASCSLWVYTCKRF